MAKLDPAKNLDVPRGFAIAWGVSRVAYAAGVVALPRRFAGPWLGESLETGGGRVAAKTMVSRDAAIAVGAIAAAVSGERVRPWLLAGAASDAADIAFTLAERRALPDRSAKATVAVAGAALLSGVAVALSVDR